MTKRYISIAIIYLICFLSPLIPGFLWLTGFFPKGQGYGIVMTAIFFLTLIIVLILLLPERHMRAGGRAPASVSLLWAIGGVIALFALQILASLINIFIFGEPPKSAHTQNVVQIARMSPLFLLAVAVIGPMLEEIVFRKILYGSLRKKMGFILAASISSIIFAFGHLDIQHLLIYFVIGFFLCYAYRKTGRIAVNMFMHAAMNAIVVAISLNVPAPAFLQLMVH
ncbi:CPBP family intramembrane glutamic endopeptidase [Sporolactobacillus putidus]|uniref:CAAX amino protease n=1 Tax=Sporolactobacillus putidus TaxID=492735 RepID=A0A917W399_9BACL|nr:type II CAAX endopeptidase family protein [Sporolactobacillus putidus]GGL62842.1 CAAX amino protease [Sporolactobacillus putidus]